MKKGITIMWMVLCLVVFAGCGKNASKGEQTGEAIKALTAGKTEKLFVSEDYEPGNRTKYLGPMMKTEKGFYRYAFADGGLHYYDVATGKTMFLCNKPECRHDGNEFCVATNKNYLSLDHCLYNDVILKYAVEETDTQYCFKILSLTLDGSAMNEVATTFTFEKPMEGFSVYQCFMYVHRNKAFLTMEGTGQAEQEEYHGVAILDLNTKEVTYLDEEPFRKENMEVKNVTAAGEYFYYCRKEGKKLLLHRYHIGTGTDESFRLLPNFAGDYVVLDEDTIAYIKSTGDMICTYRISTGQNTEQTKVLRQYYEPQGEGTYQKGEAWKRSEVRQLATDGTYVYGAEGVIKYMDDGENGERIVIRRDAYIHVYNQALEEVVLLDMAEAADALEVAVTEWEGRSYTQMLHYMGEEIYWCLTPENSSEAETYVFRCNRSDFLTGDPKFEFVYQHKEG